MLVYTDLPNFFIRNGVVIHDLIKIMVASTLIIQWLSR
jgi:hypothetical protein